MPSPLLRRFATPLAPKLEGNETRTVVFVALAFLAVFTGYRAIQNLQSSLNEEEGVGVISLGCLYGAWIFSGMLTPMAIRLLSTKGTMMLAWVFHMLYIAATFYPAWALLVPTSVLVGAMSAPLWTSQSLYIAASGYSHAKTSDHNPYNIYSRFSGIFFTIYELSHVVGNLASSLILHNGVGNRSAEGGVGMCGAQDCPAEYNSTDFEEPNDWTKMVLVSVFLACGFIGLVVTYLFVMPLPRSDWSLHSSTRQTVTSFFSVLFRTDLGLLIPLFIFQGMQQAILYSDYTRSYISCPLGIHMVGFVMASHGATTPVFTWLFSRLVHFTGRYALFMLAGFINLALMVVMYLWTPEEDQEIYIFLPPIAWGIAEGIWLTQSNSLIAFLYPSLKEAAFANYHTWRSVGLALTFSYHSFLCASTKLIVGLALLGVGLLSYTVSEFRLRYKLASRHRKSNSSSLPALSQNCVSNETYERRPNGNLAISLPYDRQISTTSLASQFSNGSASGTLSPTSPTFEDRLIVGGLPRVPSIAASSSSSLFSLNLLSGEGGDGAFTNSRSRPMSEESYF